MQPGSAMNFYRHGCMMQLRDNQRISADRHPRRNRHGQGSRVFLRLWKPIQLSRRQQLKGLAEPTGARVIYRPMLLGGVFKETGNSSPITIEAKRKYSNIDLERWAKHYGVSA